MNEERKKEKEVVKTNNWLFEPKYGGSNFEVLRKDLGNWFEGQTDSFAFIAFNELIAAHENQGELLRLSLGNVDKLNTALEAAQQRLAEADVRITKLKSFLYSLRDVTTVAGAQIRRIDKIVDEAVDENSK